MNIRYVRTPRVLWRRIGRQLVVRLLSSGDLIMLEGSAPTLWRLLEQPLTIEQLARSVATTYGASPVEVRASVGAAIDALLARGLVRTIGGEVAIRTARETA